MLLVDALDMLGERAVARFKLEGMSPPPTTDGGRGTSPKGQAMPEITTTFFLT